MQNEPEEFRLENRIKLVTIGRMTEQKGFDIAIEAAARLKAWGINFVWFFIGEGKNKEVYQELVREKQLENNIIFLGFKQNPYIYMKNCDIYNIRGKNRRCSYLYYSCFWRR